MRERLRSIGRRLFSRASGSWLFRLGGTRFDYAKEVGDGLGSSIVGATVGWVARNFPEAPPALWPTDSAAGQADIVRDHPMLRKLARPNPFYTGPLLWMATLTDWIASGDGYWIKLRSRSRAVEQLIWTPSWQMRPEGREDGSVLVDHYVYTVDGEEFDLEPSEVVHFRWGMDPLNPRRGFSPLRAVLREIFTDDEAANFTASLLRNMGVPGLLVAPDSDNVEIGEDEAEETKATLKAKFTGDLRGEPIVMTAKTKVQEFGFSPEQLVLRDLRQIPEERITAAVGIPAIVVGLGAGLARSTFTNMGEALEYAYGNGLIPMQRLLSEDVRFQLLPDFESDPFAWTFGFDLSKVRALQEDAYRLAQRFDVGIRGGWVQVGEGRRAIGLEATDADAIYLRQTSYAEVPAGGGEPRVLAPPSGGGATSSERNGHNAAAAQGVAEAVANELERRELARPAADRRGA